MLPNLGYGELLLIAVVALLVLGPEKIPEVASSLGRAVHAFKSAWKEAWEEDPGRSPKP
ncbi:MAG: twin-arginine translocase TatA/TatE family subunit [Elusimicrobia bacterium]|nr:twin-arginine translocase TatA/TatE family subunit [Elusimicrobiota bacterium]